jgi:hydrogenase assembly chaperone HypC/HupF
VCIGIPMRIVRTFEGGAWADCEGRGRIERLDAMLIGERSVGTWVLAFRGAAVRVLNAEEARQTNAALDALESAMAGGRDFDRYFADLVGPQNG